MMKEEIYQIKYEKYLDALISVGLKPHQAKTLVYLLEHGHTTCRAIERTMDLRQPEVCTALGSFQKYGWIKKQYKTKSAQGRPEFNILLAEKPSTIISALMNEADNEIKRCKSVKHELEELRHELV